VHSVKLPITATLAALLLLAGCSAPAPDVPTATSGPGVTSGPVAEVTGAPTPAASEPAGPIDDGDGGVPLTAPDGCELVQAALVRQHLGVDPGACRPIESWADGPAGLYDRITMAIDTTASAPMYMPREVCGGGGIDGALTVPGADYGYAVEGELCIVKGTLGVKTSALLDPGVATARDWRALAVALLERL
jgi:hypothetical protein